MYFMLSDVFFYFSCNEDWNEIIKYLKLVIMLDDSEVDNNILCRSIVAELKMKYATEANVYNEILFTEDNRQLECSNVTELFFGCKYR